MKWVIGIIGAVAGGAGTVRSRAKVRALAYQAVLNREGIRGPQFRAHLIASGYLRPRGNKGNALPRYTTTAHGRRWVLADDLDKVPAGWRVVPPKEWGVPAKIMKAWQYHASQV